MSVSVVIPAYNASRYLSQAIESVLAQTWPDFELIVIDDGSKDDTLEIAQRYAEQDARVKVYTQPNKGFAETLHRGFELAANEWVFRMDADDRMRPNRIERQLAFLAEHPELAVASTLVRHIDSRNRVIGHDNSRLVTHEAVQKLVSANELIGFSHPAAVVRKSAVQAVGGYRKEFWPSEDIDLWNRLVEKGYKILVQPEYLLDYRMHGTSASIAMAHLTRMRIRWMRECLVRRRAGKPELDWETFLSNLRSAPLLTRLNWKRKDMAKVFYKSAVLHYAQEQYLALFFTLSMAFLLQPKMTVRHVSSKMDFQRFRGAF
jgi:glycosyltransferase involved in cell wall biosynthesis